MLSDHEWSRLREVERLLVAEDPDFARAFDVRAQRLRRTTDPAGLRIFVAIGLLLSALMAMTGSLGGALALAAATGLVRLAWRFSAAKGRQPP